jgi:hypothetical protein
LHFLVLTPKSWNEVEIIPYTFYKLTRLCILEISNVPFMCPWIGVELKLGQVWTVLS